jgi:hypothetical protein
MQTPEAEGASIVMIGSFNPAIFQPLWLGAQQLIRADEAENAKITTIQAQVADFSTEWFQLQVLQQRLAVLTTDPRQYGPLRDLAMGMFAILAHTPVSRVGINRYFHFATPSIDVWHRIGHKLAPKEPWHDIMKLPGLRSLLMQGRRDETSEGLLYIKVEPSLKVTRGIFVEVNEEFRAPADGLPEGAQWVPSCLGTQWDSFMQFAENAGQQILPIGNA